MSFQGKVVVITGAGAGIGQALAAGFCRDGAQVMGFARTAADLEETAARFGQGRMAYTVGDVARAEDVRRLFAETKERFGRVDVLVNNAAVYPREEFMSGDIERWVAAIDVNVCGVARCCRLALDEMLRTGHGRILNVGSYAWRDPIRGASAYSASKAAVRVLTLGIAREIDRAKYPDVLVNEWIPGIFRTRMTPDAGQDPMDAYRGARVVASLPRGGPHGQVFLGDRLEQSTPGLRQRVAGKLKGLLGG